jgi:hypothetical protein
MIAGTRQCNGFSYALTQGQFSLRTQPPRTGFPQNFCAWLAPTGIHALIVEDTSTGEQYHRLALMSWEITSFAGEYMDTQIQPPVWSPDGQHAIIYGNELEDNRYHAPLIWIDLTRATVDELGDARLDRAYLAWSPDSQRLAWLNGNQLFIMSLNGQPELILEDRPMWVSAPVWSPDSQELAISAGRTRTEPNELLIYNVDQRAWHVEMSSPCDEYDCSSVALISWSPDQHRYAYYDAYIDAVYVRFRPSVQFSTSSYQGIYFSHLSWSSQSDKVALIVDNTVRFNNSLMYVIDLGKGTLTTIADARLSWWSPNGESLLYDNGFYLHLLDIDTLRIHSFADRDGGAQPLWLDAERIAYLTQDGYFEIFNANTLRPMSRAFVGRNMYDASITVLVMD